MSSRSARRMAAPYPLNTPVRSCGSFADRADRAGRAGAGGGVSAGIFANCLDALEEAFLTSLRVAEANSVCSIMRVCSCSAVRSGWLTRKRAAASTSAASMRSSWGTSALGPRRRRVVARVHGTAKIFASTLVETVEHGRLWNSKQLWRPIRDGATRRARCVHRSSR